MLGLLVLLFWKGLIDQTTLIQGSGRTCQAAGTWYYCSPLAMSGGDPYIRALMRTISASEANYPNPYTILYGGRRVDDLSHHPEECIRITVGPNQSNCTTAAGRYQFLDFTWQEKAQLYHPQPSGFWLWTSYSFEPQFQDQVMYAWLNDPQAWGKDIASLLEQGELAQVLQLLSGTWTSLGYGTEDNSVTPFLSGIYQQMLSEELAQVDRSSPDRATFVRPIKRKPQSSKAYKEKIMSLKALILNCTLKPPPQESNTEALARVVVPALEQHKVKSEIPRAVDHNI